MNRLATASLPSLLSILLATAPTVACADQAGATVAVEVVAESGAWPVGEPIDAHVLPIKVRIDNRSEQSLKLRYRDLALVGYSGDRYSALPIHNVLLTGRLPEEKGQKKVSIEVPKFAQVSFRIAPAYSEIFPNSEAYPSHFGETRENTELSRRQRNLELKPTLEMFAQLLPEGVLGAGGYVSGFLYFPEVDGWERGLRFEMAVVTADGDETLATVNVPVTAAEEP